VSPLPQGMPVQYPAPPDRGAHHTGFRPARQAAGDGGLEAQRGHIEYDRIRSPQQSGERPHPRLRRQPRIRAGCGLKAEPMGSSPCGSGDFGPLFRFPKESRGGDGSPHGTTRSAPAKNAVTLRAVPPPARGISNHSAEIPLAHPPPNRARHNRKSSGANGSVALTFGLTLIKIIGKGYGW
jgi:hypothetical protein